jgi:hypothetical protein
MRLVTVGRLAVDDTVELDTRVGTENHGIGVSSEHRARLLVAQPLHVVGRGFPFAHRFIDVGRVNDRIPPDAPEKFDTAR